MRRQLLTPQSDLKVSSKIDFLPFTFKFIIIPFIIKIQPLIQQGTLYSTIGCQKKRYELGYNIFQRVCIKIIGFKGTAGHKKNRLLHCYEVLWIHVIEAICTKARHSSV